MGVDCVLASPRVAQVDPGDEPPPGGGSIIVGTRANLRQQTSTSKSPLRFIDEDRLAHIRTIAVS
jgi:hypothetical protein